MFHVEHLAQWPPKDLGDGQRRSTGDRSLPPPARALGGERWTRDRGGRVLAWGVPRGTPPSGLGSLGTRGPGYEMFPLKHRALRLDTRLRCSTWNILPNGLRRTRVTGSAEAPVIAPCRRLELEWQGRWTRHCRLGVRGPGPRCLRWNIGHSPLAPTPMFHVEHPRGSWSDGARGSGSRMFPLKHH